MAEIGRYNTLVISKHTDFGLYLQGGELGEILLPKRYIPKQGDLKPGDSLRVFLYLDSEDRPIATTLRPRAQVGEFASLKVTDVNPVGAFLDWGLPKDVLLPHGQMRKPLQPGDWCTVYLYLDNASRRITASTKLDRHLDQSPPRYQVGEAVEFLLAERTDLGFKAIIDNRHAGLLHRNELFRPVRLGMRLSGFIREVRADGKLNLTLQAPGKAGADALQSAILNELQNRGGTLPMGDHSDPQTIAELFGCSKGAFKRAIGGLLKQDQIRLCDRHIELVDGQSVQNNQ